MNEIQNAAAILGALGGKSTSPAKQAASRANGRKGGRPIRWQRPDANDLECHTARVWEEIAIAAQEAGDTIRAQEARDASERSQ